MGAENVHIYIIYIYIISYSYLKSHEECRFFSSKISMITNLILILYNSSINNKLILRDLCFRHHIACFCSISPTKNNSKQPPEHSFASLSNLTVFRSWMNQPIKWFGSVAVLLLIYLTHLLTGTCCHLLAVLISHLKYLFIFKIISNISIQCFMFKISKHYAFVTAG